jgi:hypothetical protein
MPGYTCDICGAEPAILLQTNLAGGETMAVGEQCAPVFAVGLAEQFVGPLMPDTEGQIGLVPTEDVPQPSGRGKGKAAKTAPEAPDAVAAQAEPPSGD